MKFLVDNQLPSALARFIAQDLGAESLHVADVDMQESSDAEVWALCFSPKPHPDIEGRGLPDTIDESSDRQATLGALGKLPQGSFARCLSAAMAENHGAIYKRRTIDRTSLVT